MENIKIFVDCHVFDNTFQGTTSYLKGLYIELIKIKSKTYYLASNNSRNLENIFGKHENVIYINYKYNNKYSRLLFEIPFLISKYKIDFAHYQYIVSPIKKCKYIVTIHDVLFLDFPEYFPFSYKIRNNILFKWSARKSDILVTVSNYSKEKIQKYFCCNKIVVTHNSVDPIFLQKYIKAEARKQIALKFGLKNYFLFVSRFEPRKNHVTLLKVFVENKYYLTRELVFIGNDALECKDLDKYYNELPDVIRTKIKILKNINFNDLVVFTRAADLAIYPSIAEGFGIPPLESVASETPTICSNTTAMIDFDFMNQFLFNPMDEKEINQKINQALDFKEWKKIKQHMSQKYNWQISAKELLKAMSMS